MEPLKFNKAELIVTFTRPFQIVKVPFYKDDLFSLKGLEKVTFTKF